MTQAVVQQSGQIAQPRVVHSQCLPLIRRQCLYIRECDTISALVTCIIRSTYSTVPILQWPDKEDFFLNSRLKLELLCDKS